MGNLKKILSNKNVVTLLGALLIVVVLYLFYRWRVNAAIQPITVPYALTSLEKEAQITKESVGFIQVPQAALKGQIIYNSDYLEARYARWYIPAGSFFFLYDKDTQQEGNVCEYDEIQTSYLGKLEEGDVAYNYPVNTRTTYGNSFFPEKYFDIYLKIKDDETQEGHILFGKFVDNVKILSVRDGSGRDVFGSTEEVRTPSQLLFGVPEEINAYLRVAEKMEQVEIILVPTPADLKYKNSEVPAPTMYKGALFDYIDPYVDYVNSGTVVENDNELNYGSTNNDSNSIPNPNNNEINPSDDN